MELPSHPETDDTAGERESATTSRSTMLAISLSAVLFATIVILHLTGVVGPASR